MTYNNFQLNRLRQSGGVESGFTAEMSVAKETVCIWSKSEAL